MKFCKQMEIFINVSIITTIKLYNSNKVKMRKDNKKGLGIFISLLLTLLISIGYVSASSALDINLTQPNDISSGQDVEFFILVTTQDENSTFDIGNAKLYFSGPENFSEVCDITRNGTLENCNLDIELLIIANPDI